MSNEWIMIFVLSFLLFLWALQIQRQGLIHIQLFSTQQRVWDNHSGWTKCDHKITSHDFKRESVTTVWPPREKMLIPKSTYRWLPLCPWQILPGFRRAMLELTKQTPALISTRPHRGGCTMQQTHCLEEGGRVPHCDSFQDVLEVKLGPQNESSNMV